MEKVLAEESDYEGRCFCCRGDLVPQDGKHFWMTPSGNYCSEDCAKLGFEDYADLRHIIYTTRGE
jgi:hypothetical protein